MSWIEKEKNVGVVVFSELNSWPCNRFDKKGSDFQSLYQKLALAERKEAGHRFLVCLVFMCFSCFSPKGIVFTCPNHVAFTCCAVAGTRGASLSARGFLQ